MASCSTCDDWQMAKNRKPVESVSGSYAALPHAVLDSVAFMGAGHTARSLLFDLMRQHNGSNNGRLHLTTTWLRRRGWNSADTIQKAKQELMARGLIVMAKQGGLNAGPCLYAVTWLPISNFVGLDLRPKDYHPGAWHFMNKLPEMKPRKPCSDSRNSAVPGHGIAPPSPIPANGTERPVSGAIAVPAFGNNECLPLPPKKSSSPVVGKKGASGIRKAAA